MSEDANIKIPTVQHQIGFEQLMDDPLHDFALLWDVKSLSIEAVVTYMQAHPGHKYRFLSPDRRFYLASDQAAYKGQKINISNAQTKVIP